MTTVLALKRQKVSLISLADTPPNFDSYTEVEAEQALIGAVMNKPSIFPALAERVTPADFSILVSGYIWWAFDQLTQANKGIDLFTVSDLLGHTRPEYALDAEIQNRLIEYMGTRPKRQERAHLCRSSP